MLGTGTRGHEAQAQSALKTGARGRSARVRGGTRAREGEMQGLTRRTFMVVVIALLAALLGGMVAMTLYTVLLVGSDPTTDTMKAVVPYVVVAVLALVGIGVMTVVLSYSREVDYRAMRNNIQATEQPSDNRELRLFSNFISIASRDMRTIMNGVFGNVELANRHLEEPNRIQDCLAKIELSTHDILTLINYTEDLGRIETGTVTFARNAFDFRQFSEKLLASQSRFLAEKNIAVEYAVGDFEHTMVLSDEERLQQIFSNIVRMVATFVPQGETLHLRVDELNDKETQTLAAHGASVSTQASASVSSTTNTPTLGAQNELDKVAYRMVISCPAAHADSEAFAHLWDFSLEDSERRVQSGLALSAAINKHFAEMMGGVVFMSSSESQGIECVIEMPFDIELSTAKTTLENVEVNLSGARVLLVEDNQMNREIAEEILEEEGITVQTAGNGREAIKVFESSPVGFFDAILMDVVMPEMDGLTATRVIRSMRRFDNQTIPIIAMTANVSESDVRAVHEAGMNAHLAKPVDTALLLKTLASFVGPR